MKYQVFVKGVRIGRTAQLKTCIARAATLSNAEVRPVGRLLAVWVNGQARDTRQGIYTQFLTR